MLDVGTDPPCRIPHEIGHCIFLLTGRRIKSETRPVSVEATSRAPRAEHLERAGAAERLTSLQDALKEAGLSGQIRTGGSLAAARDPIPHALPSPLTEEDGFPPDVLLRPMDRAARGRLIEIAGGPSSGRTALAYRMVAGATAWGELAGWVDLANALDPRFLDRAGVDLEKLLWVRPPNAREALRSAELLLRSGFALVVLDLDGADPRALERLGTASWSRLLRAVRLTRSSAVLLGETRAAGSFATLGLYTERRRSLFDHGLFEGLDASAAVVRNRTGPLDDAISFRVFHRPGSTPPG